MDETTVPPLRCMTFNVRLATPSDIAVGHGWNDRRDAVIETIRREAPHVLGLQEALPVQLKELVDAFPGYAAVGRPREPGEAGEHVPLFLDLSRLEVGASGDFWLSTTPEVEGSVGWDATVPRHCTWARVRDRETGAAFAVFNTHLDRWGEMARVEAARLIGARLAISGAMPAIVMGDLNATEGSDPVAALLDTGLRDTFRVVHPQEQDVQTVHHYVDLTGPQKIDYILADGRWQVLSARIVREPARGRLPSDHFPVVAEVRLQLLGG